MGTSPPSKLLPWLLRTSFEEDGGSTGAAYRWAWNPHACMGFSIGARISKQINIPTPIPYFKGRQVLGKSKQWLLLPMASSNFSLVCFACKFGFCYECPIGWESLRISGVRYFWFARKNTLLVSKMNVVTGLKCLDVTIWECWCWWVEFHHFCWFSHLSK